MAFTIEELYEAYMDEEKDFAEDVFGFFGGEGLAITSEEFKEQYGMYLPIYDPTAQHLAFQDKAISYMEAADTYALSKDATDRVFSEEMRKVSGGLEEDIAKGKQVAGGIGLRSGALESALADTMTSSTNKATNLGDRLDIQERDTLNTYNEKMVDATLDYEEDVYETKEAFYDRLMDSLARLSDIGAFDRKEGWKSWDPINEDPMNPVDLIGPVGDAQECAGHSISCGFLCLLDRDTSGCHKECMREKGC